MAESLILFTIGPVQRFIETARKTEDLWMGSYILSYLNGMAMDALTDHFRNQQIKIIFPSLENQPLIKFFKDKEEKLDDAERERLKLPTLPNRLLALDKSGTVTEDAMKKVERNVRDEFARIAEYVFDQAFGQIWRKSEQVQKMFKRQITHFLEIYWVIHPMNGAGYKEEYNLLERKLGGVKSCRRFVQVQEESRKCSLCGEREVIHFSRFETETMGKMNEAIKQDWKEHWTKDTNIPYHKYLASNEFLCGVCLTKRLGGTYFAQELGLDLKGTFPSTAEVATAAFKLTLYQGLATKEIQDCYATYMTLIDKLGREIKEITGIPKTAPLSHIQSLDFNRIFESDRDGSLLLEDTLTEKYIIRSFTHKEPQNAQLQAKIHPYIEELKKYRKEHLLKTQRERFEQEQKLLHDRLADGKITESEKTRLQEVQLGFGMKPAKYYAAIVMDGDSMGKKLNNVRDRTEHEQISELLNNYSSQDVPEIVENRNLGKLLYAGGDDLVALVNLKDLFAVLQQLHQAFPSDQLCAIEGLKNLDGNHSFGVSAGVCIAHYKTQLGTVRRHAKNMEQKAKKLDGKNAVSIALLKHSGNISTTCFKWEYEQFDVLECARETSHALREWVSDQFLYSLREEFSHLLDKHDTIKGHTGDMIQTELVRLLYRRRRKEGIADHEKKIEQLSQQLAELQKHIGYFDRFMGFLEICNFIAREG